MSNTEGEPDVNDFLMRIKELGNKRDQEDEDRTRKLEEEILQGRKERQARRAERALSISPTKSSPASTPTRPRSTIISNSESQITPESSRRGSVADTAMEALTNSSSALDFKRTSQFRDSPSSAMPSRNSPLSWARRPDSSDKPRTRPLSMIAIDSTKLGQASTPTSDDMTPGEDINLSREQIAESLASKDPVWFRQTADRGVNSPAYRKNQVEDEERSTHEAIQMPGMSRVDPITDKPADETGDSSSSPTRRTRSTTVGSVQFGSGSRASYHGNSNASMGSPLPMSDAQRLDPPSSEAFTETRGLAMSPSQGRISPDRSERPFSQTKGMGGFVQSAMMKRSESMNKRWSAQSTGRKDSISTRNSYEPNTASLSMDNLSLSGSRPTSRPTSSHSNATMTQETQRPDTSNSMRSTMTASTANEGFTRPSFGLTRSQTSIDIRDDDALTYKPFETQETPPLSPSKAMDQRRWSPTKSSWLESALNKPESPKPKATPPPQQPAWMTEISKARQKSSVDLGRPAIKHEVNIGGLMRSPAPGPLPNSSNVRGLASAFAPSITPKRNIESMINQDSKSNAENANTEGASTTSTTISKGVASTPVGLPKTKPVTPPKNDFRSVLKPRQAPADEKSKEEPEFKNIFGQLRRTKTQNYVAPDPLKDNILRGKVGLNITGGPKKTERQDEFKEAILKKKEDFKQVQAEGKGVSRSSSNAGQDAALPEALARRQTLIRNGSISGSIVSPSSDAKLPSPFAAESPTPALVKETSAPGRLQARSPPVGGKLAGRFNPGLADLLARGPPSLANEASKSVSQTASTTDAEPTEPGPQLTHMTKGRARGPKRKAPTTTQAAQTVVPSTEINAEPKADSPLTTFPPPKQMPDAVTSPRQSPPLETNTEKPQESFSSSQPSSPRKLDMKRRSLFLQEASKDKVTPQLEAPKPLSPVKNANFTESMVKTQPNKIEAGIRPDAKLESPIPLRSFTPPRDREFQTYTEPDSPETAKLRPAPLSPRKANSMKALPQPKLSPLALDKPLPSSPKTSPASDFPSGLRRSKSVKNAAAMWEQSTVESSPRTRSPIKLPTYDDEKAAAVGAGLRPLSPSKTGRATDAGVQADPRPSLQASSARPLPNPPSKAISSPPVNGGLRSPSLQYSPVPQASEASQLLADFFGDDAKPTSHFATDTAGILMMRAEPPSDIRTIQANLFQISADGKKQPVPTHQERVLFEREMYLCPHTFTTPAGKKVFEVYWWAGDEVPASTVANAEIYAEREARNLGARLVKIRQGTETPEFYQALGGIIIIRRGSANKYDSLAPHILCARQQFGMIVFDEVDYSATTLCSGFPYLISTPTGKTWLWKGRGSTAEELGCARLLGMDISMTGDIEEVEDGLEYASFLNVFGYGSSIPQSADHWRLKPNYSRYASRLFRANPSSRHQIIEITPFTQADLSPSNVYVLDAFFEIYIIVGAKAQSQYGAFHNALLFGQEYGILAASMEDRPFVPVSTVVIEGIPKDLKSVFRKWNDKLSPTIMHPPSNNLKRGRSLRVVPLTAALEATRG
ncbi:gelsolin repeat protein [Rutstroemia sp. NJR-2017a BVV2]|nr:gelsolin repeat protein [Rutstroemia sp. NJR-2017a BVV2]